MLNKHVHFMHAYGPNLSTPSCPLFIFILWTLEPPCHTNSRFSSIIPMCVQYTYIFIFVKFHIIDACSECYIYNPIQQNSSINKYRKSSRSQRRTYICKCEMKKKYTKTWHKWFAQTRQKILSCYIYKMCWVTKGAT